MQRVRSDDEPDPGQVGDSWWRRWWPVLLACAVSRFLVVGIGLGAQYAASSRDLVHLPFAEAGTYIHYADVVRNGYTLENATQYPLLPALMWLVHQLGVPLAATGVIISNLLFVVGLVGFAALGARYVGERAAIDAALVLTLFPFSHFFSLASTESAMLAALSLAALAALRGTSTGWLLAGLAAAVCALARPPAIFVGFVLLGLALSQWRAGTLRGGRLAAALVALAAPAIAVIGFFTYLHVRLGDFFASVHAQGEFDRSPSLAGPIKAVASAIRDTMSGTIGVAIELAMTIALVIAIWLFWVRAQTDRWERGGWVAFGAASILLPLATGIVWQMPRFALLVPPAFWMAGYLLRGRPTTRDIVIVTLSMALATKVVFEVVGVVQ